MRRPNKQNASSYKHQPPAVLCWIPHSKIHPHIRFDSGKNLLPQKRCQKPHKINGFDIAYIVAKRKFISKWRKLNRIKFLILALRFIRFHYRDTSKWKPQYTYEISYTQNVNSPLKLTAFSCKQKNSELFYKNLFRLGYASTGSFFSMIRLTSSTLLLVANAICSSVKLF